MSAYFKDYYNILGIPNTASLSTIDIAYRRLALRYHPDLNHAAGATEKMQLVNEAYMVLRNPVKRAKYDQEYRLYIRPVNTSSHTYRREYVYQKSPSYSSSPVAPARPAPVPPREVHEEEPLVLFMLDGNIYAFNIYDVENIVWMQEIQVHPEAPEFIDGVITIRGNQTLPIIDLRRHLGLEKADPTRSTRVIILKLNGIRLGVVVDSIEKYTNFPARDIQAPPLLPYGMEIDFIRGVLYIGMQPIILFDVLGLLSTEEMASLRSFSLKL
ncbi:MAG TPA: chemotaxis protein CheW [Anaerolineaceae bacterium]